MTTKVKKRELKEVGKQEPLILDLLSDSERKRFKKQNNGTYRGPCPDCGDSAANPLIIWPETNYAYCHKTACRFNLLEFVALKHEIIRCNEGRYDKQDPPVLVGESFKETLDVLKIEYGEDTFHKVMGNLFEWKYGHLQIPPEVFSKEQELILTLMFSNNKDEKNPDLAIEKMVKMFERYYYVFTLRDDVKTEIWVYSNGIYIPQGSTYIKEYVRLIIGKYYRPWMSLAVQERIVADTYVDPSKFFEVKNIYDVPVQNGVLNLKQKKLTDFTPRKIFFSKLPLYFNPKAKPKLTLKFITEIVRPTDVKIIQELFGYTLLKDYPISKSFMFLGPGANGKSRLLLLLKIFVGPENCSNESLDYIQKNSFAASGLFGKLANIAGDISPATLNDTEKFKQLTGGDRISADRKFKTPIYFTNYAKLINACNELPKTKDLSDGFFRRWILMTFPNKFVPEKEYERLKPSERNGVYIADENIIEKISTKDEMSGLLNWGLVGLNRLLKKGSFSDSHTTDEIKTAWIRKSNSFAAFALDHLEQKYDSYVLKSDLKVSYSKYCKEHKVKIEDDKSIKETLSEMFGAWGERSSFEGRPLIWKNIEYLAKKPQKSSVIGVSDVIGVSNSFSAGGTIQPQKNMDSKTCDKYDTYDKKKSTKNKEKDTRKEQFYDADECKEITSEITEKDVFAIILENKKVGISLKNLNKKAGVGVVKFKNSLLKKGKILLKNKRYFPK